MIVFSLVFIQGCFGGKGGKFDYNQRLVIDGEIEPTHPLGKGSDKTIEGIDIKGLQI